MTPNKKPPESVAAAFAAFDESLNLDPLERARAIERHNALQAALRDAEFVSSTFLQGSFARKTMVKPLHDVDMVALLHERHADLRVKGSAADAIELMKEPILKRFPNAQFDVDKKPAKALQITFPDVPFTMDVVVAYEGPEGEDVYIANRETGEWEPSGTRRLIRLIRERNAKTNNRFIHQVRMLKSLTNLHPKLDGVCGLVMETLAYDTVLEEMPDADAVRAVLTHAADAVRFRILEPADLDDLTAKWSSEDRARYSDEFRRLARLAAEAASLDAAGDVSGATAVWATVLGDDFPVAPSKLSEADALAALGGAGSVTSTGRISATPAGSQRYRPTRAARSTED